MKRLIKFVKRLNCKHTNQKCITNFYGDAINMISTKKIYRSAWECKDCGEILYSEYLEPTCKVINWGGIK